MENKALEGEKTLPQRRKGPGIQEDIGFKKGKPKHQGAGRQEDRVLEDRTTWPTRRIGLEDRKTGG